MKTGQCNQLKRSQCKKVDYRRSKSLSSLALLAGKQHPLFLLIQNQ